MKELNRTQLDLELILPYVNHLKEVINQGRRIERRKEQAELFKGLQERAYGTTKK
jgi:hypothetical protein